MISYLLLQEQQENKTQVSFNQNSRISYTWRRFVRFPIAPDKLPERDWLGAPLWKQNPEVEDTWKFLNAEKRKPKKEIKKNSQSYNKILRGAGDHCPTTRVHRVLIPIAKNAVRIIQCCLHINQSFHCRKGTTPIDRDTY